MVAVVVVAGAVVPHLQVEAAAAARLLPQERSAVVTPQRRRFLLSQQLKMAIHPIPTLQQRRVPLVAAGAALRQPVDNGVQAEVARLLLPPELLQVVADQRLHLRARR